MMYICDCGFAKSAQPYKSAITKRMICDKCAGPARHNPPRKVVEIRVERTTVLGLTKTLTKRKVFG